MTIDGRTLFASVAESQYLHNIDLVHTVSPTFKHVNWYIHKFANGARLVVLVETIEPL